jgi:hypothetical protein
MTSPGGPYGFNPNDIEFMKTAAGLIVPKSAGEEFIKAGLARDAESIAKEQKKRPRFFSEYMMGMNMIAYGAREKPQGTPTFSLLYEASKKSFIDAILIRARTDQTKMVFQKSSDSKPIGFSVVHDRHEEDDYEPTENIRMRCHEMETFLLNPTPKKYTAFYPHQVRPHVGLKDLVARLIRAELIIDRKVIYRYKKANGKGYAAFHWLPGDTIRPVHEGVREWAKKNDPKGAMGRNTVEMMSVATGFDIARSSYVQLVDGMIIAAFTDDEISVHISSPSDQINRWGYGESRLEISLDITTSIINAWKYNQELFKTNYPEAILSVTGDYDKEGLEAFKKVILSEGGGVENNWRLPVIAGDDSGGKEFKVTTHKLRDSPKDMLYDKMFHMLVALKCASYGCHPSVINFTMEGGNSSAMFGRNPSDEIEFSQEHGFKPTIEDISEWFTRSLIKPQYDDLKLIIEGLEPDDKKVTVELMEKRGKNWVTRNESRQKDGLNPIGDINDPENPWNFPNDASMPQYLTAISSAKLQADMAEQEEGGEGEGGEGVEGEGGQQPKEGEAPDGEPTIEGANLGTKEQAKGAGEEKITKAIPEVQYLEITIIE